MKDENEFKPAPKMNTFVGFLRLANYVNACCVIFGVILSIYLRGMNWDRNEAVEKEKRDSYSGAKTKIKDSFFQIMLGNLTSGKYYQR